MICVSIGRGRHKQTIAEHKHLVEQGAGLINIDGAVRLAKALRTDVTQRITAGTASRRHRMHRFRLLLAVLCFREHRAEL